MAANSRHPGGHDLLAGVRGRSPSAARQGRDAKRGSTLAMRKSPTASGGDGRHPVDLFRNPSACIMPPVSAVTALPDD